MPGIVSCAKKGIIELQDDCGSWVSVDDPGKLTPKPDDTLRKHLDTRAKEHIARGEVTP